jgi:hypothetical protein
MFIRLRHNLWRGRAWFATARLGRVWHGPARRGTAGMFYLIATQFWLWRGPVRSGLARRGLERCGAARQGKVRQG